MIRKQQQEELRLHWAATIKQWAQLRPQWDDIARSHFEALHWSLIERTMPPALRDLESLTQVLEQAERQLAGSGPDGRRRGF